MWEGAGHPAVGRDRGGQRGVGALREQVLYTT